MERPRALARELMVKCWSEEPGSRPNTKEIKRKLREINGGKLVIQFLYMPYISARQFNKSWTHCHY